MGRPRLAHRWRGFDRVTELAPWRGGAGGVGGDDAHGGAIGSDASQSARQGMGTTGDKAAEPSGTPPSEAVLLGRLRSFPRPAAIPLAMAP
jgi:hypothetical protein